MHRVERPVSPHLQVYRWRITMWLSSLHRISGLLLSLGAFVFCGWLIALASGPESYRTAEPFFASLLFKVLAAGWVLCFCYHLLNGIRHLVWDMGLGFERDQIRMSGWIVIVLTAAAATAFILAVVV